MLLLLQVRVVLININSVLKINNAGYTLNQVFCKLSDKPIVYISRQYNISALHFYGYTGGIQVWIITKKVTYNGMNTFIRTLIVSRTLSPESICVYILIPPASFRCVRCRSRIASVSRGGWMFTFSVAVPSVFLYTSFALTPPGGQMSCISLFPIISHSRNLKRTG